MIRQTRDKKKVFYFYFLISFIHLCINRSNSVCRFASVVALIPLVFVRSQRLEAGNEVEAPLDQPGAVALHPDEDLVHGVAGGGATGATHGSHGQWDPVLDAWEEERDLGEDQRFRHRSLDEVGVERVEVNTGFLYPGSKAT